MKDDIVVGTARYARLPGWARTEIETLTRQRDTWKRRALAGSLVTSNVFCERGPGDRYGLEENTRITFQMGGEGPEWQRQIEVQHGHPCQLGGAKDQEWLCVRGLATTLLVEPAGSNSIGVRIAPRG